MTWGSYMPHKFKIAVSGCPRNCAEATIKDFGVVCVDSVITSYSIHYTKLYDAPHRVSASRSATMTLRNMPVAMW